MSNQFLHVSLNLNSQVNEDLLKKKFNLAIDWAHYMPCCWIVETTSSAQKWHERLKPLLGPRDTMFICRIDLQERQGWMPKWVWEWIREKTFAKI